GPVVDEAGAVEQHVDGAELGRGVADGTGVQDVEQAGADPRDAVQLRQLGGIDVGGDHRGTLARERLGRGAADALRRGGDERLLTLQPTGHVWSPRMSSGPASGRPCRPRLADRTPLSTPPEAGPQADCSGGASGYDPRTKTPRSDRH